MILVTGAGGFVGGHLVKRLLAEGHKVRAVDIRPVAQWHQTFTQAPPNILDLRLAANCADAVRGISEVYNLAADMGGIGFIETHRADCMMSVLINAHMLQAARDADVERYFFASSACAYPTTIQGDVEAISLRESDMYPAMCEDGYGWEKLFSERLCRHFREDYGLQTRIGRYHNSYGPFGDWEGERVKAPAAICRKVAEAVRDGHETLEIWGDGQQTRSFMWIEDNVEGTLRLMDSGYPDPVNIGSSELVSINQLADIVEEIAGTSLRRVYDLTAPQGVRGRNSDNTLCRTILGWEPSTPLADGIEKTYRWIEQEVNRVPA